MTPSIVVAVGCAANAFPCTDVSLNPAPIVAPSAAGSVLASKRTHAPGADVLPNCRTRGCGDPCPPATGAHACPRADTLAGPAQWVRDRGQAAGAYPSECRRSQAAGQGARGTADRAAQDPRKRGKAQARDRADRR